MFMHRKTRRQRNAEAKLKAGVERFLFGLGARPPRQPAGLYDLELETPVGLLWISVQDGWVATRFDEVARAHRLTRHWSAHRSNPYSGKWNFHFDPLNLDPTVVVPYLEFWFDCLLNSQPHVNV